MNRELREIISILGTVLRPWKYYPMVSERLKEQLPYTPSKKKIRKVYIDFILFRIKWWGSIDDFFKSQMYRKSDFVREESLSRYIRFPWRDSLQQKELWPIFQDKRVFYNEYNEYLNRKWMIVGKDTNWDEFLCFVENCSYEVFAKDPLGCGGKEVELLNLNTEEKQRSFWNSCKKGKEKERIIEEKLMQCEDIYSFSNSSVNTFRIITLVDNFGNAHVATGVFRIGRGNTERDNFSSGGMAAMIDVQTGIVSTPAKDGKGREYLVHPDTGKQIVGYKIEDWEEYKKYAISLALKNPKMKYVGWDIIKDNKGKFCVIEGNKDAGTNAIECLLSYGVKPYYESILKGENSKGGN